MLEEVRITGLGVIDDVVLEPAPGLTVVTGETGAGKTMVVTGLGLLFGGRGDPARVRPGADRATVEGRLRVDPGGHVAEQVDEAGGELDDGGQSLVVSRSVSAEGRSRAYAGGRAVPVSLLTYLADELVAVHGQADQQQLLKPGRQRAALDRYAGDKLAALLAEYQRAFHRHREVRDRLTELTARARERDQEAAELRAGLDEIARLEPAEGEDADLLAEEERLAHADALHGAATSAHEALVGDPSAGSYEGVDAAALLTAARQALEGVAQHDAALGGLAGQLADAAYVISDVAGELASYVQSVEADPARLAVVQERRAELARLIRAYGSQGDQAGTLAAVLAWAKDAALQLTELDGDDDRGSALAAEEADLAARADDLAGQLTELRVEAAGRFAQAVTTELVALAMPHAELSVTIAQAADLSPHGRDDVEIRLAAHPGAPPLPLHKGASGGELSRVMLAIEVVFAGADPVPTFVFDEVDAGVGGKAAVEIGRRLARLARLAQVIVVTHLPQVAAFADNHLVVAKSDDGSITSSGVIRLDHAGRVRELSRMLGGLEDSEYGQAHAAELLALAAEHAAKP
ncbi:MAG: DNA repair protein RecN [Kitasatospora sp.]|jgi:DNA repair protein RecN (Recombination protein N)|nr:DNA repair protein RecN [Kitasatospora sp.]